MDALIIFVLVFVPFINFALMLGYALCRDSWKPLGGQSIGKRLVGIRVMNNFTGHDLWKDYSTDITRNLPLLVLGLDLLVAFTNGKGQRLGDRNARTIVVNDCKSLADFNKSAVRNKKRFVKLYDDYDSHGVH